MARKKIEKAEAPEAQAATAPFVYLGMPYAGHPAGPRTAWEAAVAQVALLLDAGVPVYCPIAHFHWVDQLHLKVPAKDAHAFWMAMNRPLMVAAAGLIVCKLSGWETSKGLAEEREIFSELGKPEWEMEPGKVPEILLK